MSVANAMAESQAGTGSVSQPAPKTAKLFKNGRSQAVRLPKEFRFEGKEVAIRRDAATGEVVLTPTADSRKKMSWTELFAIWDSLGAPDLDFERQVSTPVEREFF
jgi:antitoxin VapB